MCKGPGAEAETDHLKDKKKTKIGMQSVKETAVGVEICVLTMCQTR